MYSNLLRILYSIFSFAKFYTLLIFTTRQELEPDNSVSYLILSGLSVLTVLVFVVYKLYNSPPKQETAPTSEDIKTESLEDLSIVDLEKKLIDATRVVRKYSRTRQVQFDQEIRKLKSKLTKIHKKFANTFPADQTVRKLFSVTDDLQSSLRTKQDGVEAQKKCADSVFGSTKHVPADAIKSAKRRSTSKPTQEVSTPVKHAKNHSVTKVMSSEAKITKTYRSTNKTGICRPKDTSQDMIAATTKKLTETSVGRRQSARMEYPSPLKRLVMTKKSAVEAATPPSSPKTRRQNRKDVSKQDWCDSNAAKANIASEPDFGNQDPAFSKVVVKEAISNEKLTYSLLETDNPVFGIKTNAVRDTESNESYDCTVLLPAQSRQFELTALSSDENVEIHNSEKMAKSLVPSNNAPSTAINASSADVSRRKSLSPKPRGNPLKERLIRRNSDLAPGSRSNSFHRRKLYDNKCKLKDSSANLNRPLSADTAPAVEKKEHKNCMLELLEKLKRCDNSRHIIESNSNQDILPLGRETYVSSNSIAEEKHEKPQMEGSCSNRGRPKSHAKQNDSTKTKSPEQNQKNPVKNRLKDNVSNLGRPVSSQREGVVLSIDKRQEIEAEHHMKDTISSKYNFQLVKKEDLTSNTKRSKKINVEQEKPQLEGSCSNRGRPKSPAKQNDSTKTKVSEKIQENSVKNRLKDNVSNLDQPVSSQKEGHVLSIDNRQAIEAQHHMKNTISSKEKLQPTKKLDLSSTANRPEKRKDKQETPQLEGSCSNQGRPKSPEYKKESTKTQSSDKKQENRAKTYTTDNVSNLGRSRSAQKECDVGSIHKRKDFEAQNQLKETMSKQASFQIVKREDSSSKDMASSKEIENQEKPHLERRCSNQGRSKSTDKQVEAMKTKSSDRKIEMNAENHMNDSNVGRPKSARKESVFLAGEKKKAKLNINDIITNKDRPKSAGPQDLSPFEKRKEYQAKFHLKSLTSNVGRS